VRPRGRSSCPHRRVGSARGRRGVRGRGGEGGRGEGGRGREAGSAFTWTHRRVHADASILSPGNFITDAIVRPSHRRPNGHRPIVRPSVHPSSIVRVTTLVSGVQTWKLIFGDSVTTRI
jgi:hypothetical protein